MVSYVSCWASSFSEWEQLLIIIFLDANSTRIYINAEIVSIGKVVERSKDNEYVSYTLKFLCEDGKSRQSEQYDGSTNYSKLTKIKTGKLRVGVAGAILLRVDKKGREKVTGFPPGFNAHSRELDSEVN